MTITPNMTEEEKDAYRKKKVDLLQKLQSTGITEGDANIVFDMMVQAKEEAIDKIEEVCNRAPMHLKDLIMMLTFDCFTSAANDLHGDIKEGITLSIFKASLFSRMQAGAQEKG